MPIETRPAMIQSMIEQAMILGWKRPQMSAWAAKQEPPVSEAELDAAYAACVDRWIEQANPPAQELYALHVARREGLYRKAMEQGSLDLAFKIAIDIARLQQQYTREVAQAAQADKETDLEARIKARGKTQLHAVPNLATATRR
jgi:hypothetical protein